MKNNHPKKPPTQKEQIDLIWEFLFNHLTHKVQFLSLKMTFVLIFMGLILGLLGIVIARVG